MVQMVHMSGASVLPYVSCSGTVILKTVSLLALSFVVVGKLK
jgi:hypothetical protein